MSPETVLLIVNATLAGFGWLVAYPLLRVRELDRLLRYDLAVSLAALLLSGLLFAGSGVRFSLVVVDANWFVFALLTFAAIETPLGLWYCRRHGIRLDGTPPRDG